MTDEISITLPNGKGAQWLSLNALLDDKAAKRPQDLAVEISGLHLTWSDLDRQSAQAAGNLLNLGAKAGDRIATMLHNCVEQIILMFAAQKLGCIFTPLNVSLKSEDLAHVIQDSSPRIMLCDNETFLVADELQDELKTSLHIMCLGQSSAIKLFCDTDTAVPSRQALPGDPALIIYTGGTTGLPKGVILPNFAAIAAGFRYAEAFKTVPTDRHLSVLPLFHVGGLFIGLIGPMVAGIPTHIEKRFGKSVFWRRVRETGATIIDPIGTMVSVLCDTPNSKEDIQNPARASLGVLSQIPPKFAEQFPKRFGLEMVNVYSLTESGGTLIVSNPIGSSLPEANGKPFGWCEVSIRSEEDLPFETGEIGEICLRPTIPWTFMTEYFNAPDQTLACMRNFWLHTGDFGYLNEDGFLFFSGRRAHWMRVRGENVSAYEVEAVISEYSDVDECVAVGIPAELGDEDVKIFIIAAEGSQMDPEALIHWCAKRLASFKVPRFVEFVDSFPRSAAKREVERNTLRNMPNNAAFDLNTTRKTKISK